LKNQTAISIVTPCFNQAKWLSASTGSILGQNYSPLEYFIMDGGSTDGSREMIQSLAGRLHAWKSEKDDGQYDAINKGFLLSSAAVMGWLNGDDIHLPWTLSIVGEIFAALPQIRWLTTCFPIVVDADGRPRDCRHSWGFSRKGILHGETLPGSTGFVFGGIQQESTFWRRDLWEQAGGRLETEFDYAADFDLWMRFAKHADIYSVTVPLAGFRRHGDQKTSRDMNRYRAQAMESFQRHGKGFSNRRLRTFARKVLPQQLKPLAAKLGWLYPAKIVKKNRDSGEWGIQEILA
jgi:glycosyltransferase involved in cell wall biosynthesis